MHTADSFSRQPDRKEFLLCISTKICRPVLYCYDDAMYRSVACYNNAAVFCRLDSREGAIWGLSIVSTPIFGMPPPSTRKLSSAKRRQQQQ